MKKFILLISMIAGAIGFIVMLSLAGKTSKTDGGIYGTLSFVFICFVIFAPVVYFILKSPGVSSSKKDSSKKEVLKENIYNEIKKKHSV